MPQAETWGPLTDDERAVIAAKTRQDGVDGARRFYGVGSEAIAKAIAGLPLKRGTIALFRIALNAPALSKAG